MTVTSDATSTGHTTTTTNALSWSHTCSASATDLYVGIGLTTAAGDMRSTSVKYNNVAMSSVTTTALQFSGSTTEGELWHLANPTSGANTIAATFSGNCRAAGNGHSVLAASGSSAFGAVSIATGESASATVSGIVSAGASDLVLGFLATRKGDTATISSVGPNETLISDTTATGTSGSLVAQGAMDTKAGNGSTTSASFNLAASTSWVMIGVALLAAGAGGGGSGSSGVAYYTLRRRR